MKDVEKIFKYDLYFNLSKLYREINNIAENIFLNLGLSPSYIYLILIINSKKKITIGEASNLIGLNPCTVTRLVDKLVIKGFVSREQEGRNIFLKSNEKLETIILEIYDCLDKLDTNYRTLFSKEDYNSLIKIIKKNNS